MTASTNTIWLYRVLRVAPEKIYRAFLNEEAMSKLAETEIPDQA
jgi:hypothetical protein